MIKYSFVLPAYKALFFREALGSILSQTYNNFELIIVNDASPEDLESIVKSYDDPRIRYYVNEKNIGGKDLVAQWNHCLKYAKGKYVILASDDDLYSAFYLEKMDKLVCKYPGINVFRSRIQMIDAEGKITHVFDSINEYVEQTEYIYHWMRGQIGSGIGHFIFNKETLNRRGGFYNFPLAWGSDDVTVNEMAESGVVFSNEILFSFRNSGLNITSKKNDSITLKRKLEAYILLEKWLDEYVDDLGKRCDSNNKYYNYIVSHKQDFMKSLVRYVLSSSSLCSIMHSLKEYYTLQCITYIEGAYWIIRMLIVRIARSWHLIK